MSLRVSDERVYRPSPFGMPREKQGGFTPIVVNLVAHNAGSSANVSEPAAKQVACHR